jgi:hypothetical protein
MIILSNHKEEIESLKKKIKKDVLSYVQGKQFGKKRKREILGGCWKRHKQDVTNEICRIVDGRFKEVEL